MSPAARRAPPDLPPAEVRRAPLRLVAPTTAALLGLLAVHQALTAQGVNALTALVLSVPAVLACVIAFGQRYPLGHASRLLSLSTTAGCLLALYLLGVKAQPLIYLTMTVHFFINRPSLAVTLNALLLMVLLLTTELRAGLLANPTALLVAVLIVLLGYLFSRRLQGDRKRLEAMATHDPMTGLPNRRALEVAVNDILQDARQDRYLRALVVLDIDLFKRINDRYGHAAGDTALRELAAILRAQLREYDQAFRLGGEEFVVLVTALSPDALAAVCERLRTAVADHLRVGNGTAVTISLGAAMYAGETQWDSWFGRADAALYVAKEAGRNRYIIAPPPPAVPR